jgi:hypothetical protein
MDNMQHRFIITLLLCAYYYGIISENYEEGFNKG